MKILKFIALFTFVLALSGPTPAQSATTAVVTTGHLTTFQYPLANLFSVGQEFTLTFVYQGLGVDVSPSSSSMYYTHAAANMSFVSGGYQITAPDAAFVIAPSGSPQYQIVSATYLATTIPGTTISGPLVVGLVPYWISIEPNFDIRQNPSTWPTTGGNFYIAFATSVTPDVAFGVSSGYGIIDGFQVISSLVPEISRFILTALGICFVFGIRQRNLTPLSNFRL
jgi:hypothetical protein